jgi:predicted deacylase
MPDTIEVAGIRAKRGERKFGLISVAETPFLSVDLPLTIINGENPGKILCVTAGVHGCEYVGIEAALRLSRNITPKQLHGALIVIPIINVPAFNSRTMYVCPIDNININRVFPGNEGRSISHIIARNIFDKVIAKVNFLVDFHSGDLVEALLPFTAYFQTGKKEIDRISQDMGARFNVKYELEAQAQKEEYSPVGASYAQAAKIGIPAIISEAGELGILDGKYVNHQYKGVLDILAHLRMLPKHPETRFKPKILHKGAYLYAERSGLFYPNVRVGQIVSKGRLLGRICNIDGEVVQEITAPSKCVVLCLGVNLSVQSGHVLFMTAAFKN